MSIQPDTRSDCLALAIAVWAFSSQFMKDIFGLFFLFLHALTSPTKSLFQPHFFTLSGHYVCSTAGLAIPVTDKQQSRIKHNGGIEIFR